MLKSITFKNFPRKTKNFSELMWVFTLKCLLLAEQKSVAGFSPTAFYLSIQLKSEIIVLLYFRELSSLSYPFASLPPSPVTHCEMCRP